MSSSVLAAGYTARLLPEAEWPRLPDDVQRALTSGFSLVVVVEDPHGDIVGRWCAINQVHLEGLEIQEDHRGNPAVGGKLFLGMLDTLCDHGITSVLTIAQSEGIQTLCDKVGFTRVPGTLHHLALRPSEDT